LRPLDGLLLVPPIIDNFGEGRVKGFIAYAISHHLIVFFLHAELTQVSSKLVFTVFLLEAEVLRL
jgi:hypothetical protein